LSLVEDVIWKK